MSTWNLPPGTTTAMIDEYCGGLDAVCEICGLFTESCICPECPRCRVFGDPACYPPKGHHLQASVPQILSKWRCDGIRREDEAADAAFWAKLQDDYEQYCRDNDPDRQERSYDPEVDQ